MVGIGKGRLNLRHPRSVRGSTVLRLSPLVLVGMAVAACGSSSAGTSPPTAKASPEASYFSTVSGPSPQSVSLTVKDLPSGYKQVQGQANTINQQQYASYTTTFTKSAGPAPTNVQSQVGQSVNTKGAQQLYDTLLRNGQAKGNYAKIWKVSNVGDVSTGGTRSAPSSGATITTYAVLFRRGTYVAVVTMTGKQGTFTKQQVESLASTIDGNIQKGA